MCACPLVVIAVPHTTFIMLQAGYSGESTRCKKHGIQYTAKLYKTKLSKHVSKDTL